MQTPEQPPYVPQGEQQEPATVPQEPAAKTPPTRGRKRDLARVLFLYYWSEAKTVLTAPDQFFSVMETEGGFFEPGGFLVISSIIYSFLQAIGHFNPLLFFVFIDSIIKVVVGAFVVQLVLKKFGGKGSLEGTFRVLAYSKATLLFAWISLGTVPIGGIVSLVYAVYLNIVGCSYVHGLSKKQVALPIALVAAAGIIAAKVLHIA